MAAASGASVPVSGSIGRNHRSVATADRTRASIINDTHAEPPLLLGRPWRFDGSTRAALRPCIEAQSQVSMQRPDSQGHQHADGFARVARQDGVGRPAGSRYGRAVGQPPVAESRAAHAVGVGDA